MADDQIVSIDTSAEQAPSEMEQVDTLVDVKDADKHPDDDFDPEAWLAEDDDADAEGTD